MTGKCEDVSRLLNFELREICSMVEVPWASASNALIEVALPMYRPTRLYSFIIGYGSTLCFLLIEEERRVKDVLLAV